mgnify:CR=1 FL=1
MCSKAVENLEELPLTVEYLVVAEKQIKSSMKTVVYNPANLFS